MPAVRGLGTRFDGTPNLTYTVGFSSPLPVAGDGILIGISIATAGVTSVADNQGVGNVYTVKATAATATNAFAYIYRCLSIGAVTNPFTVTITLANNAFGCAGGIDVAGALLGDDQTGTNGTAGSATTGTVTASGANANANDLVFAVFCLNNNDTNAAISDPPAGYTSVYAQQNSVTTVGAEAAYKVVSAIETSSVTWNWTSVSEWDGALYTAQITPPPVGVTLAWIT